MITVTIFLPFHPFVLVMMAAYPTYLLIRMLWRSFPVIGG